MVSDKSESSRGRFNLVRFLGAKMWREAEQEAIANLDSSTSWGDRLYWELEFKAAFDKCEWYNISEDELKVCTHDGFWKDVERLARRKLAIGSLSRSEQDYWNAMLAKAIALVDPSIHH